MIHFKFSPKHCQPSSLELAQMGLARLMKDKEAGFLMEQVSADVLTEVNRRAEEISKVAKQVVIVGIGGSQLGAKALVENGNGGLPLHFWDHLEPETFAKRKQKLGPLENVHWIWISKSGTTIEILKTLEIVEGWYSKQGNILAKISTVIAQTSSAPLQKWAIANSVPRLEIGENVSGRYSVFSPAGLLPAALVGIDLNQINLGIRLANGMMDKVTEVAAEALESFQRREWLFLLWTYSDRLRPLASWFQQLWAESLAKSKTRSGAAAPKVSFPVPCVGSLDQHSILQQVMEGSTEHWIWFFRVKSMSQLGESVGGKSLGQIFTAQAEGTTQALQEVKKNIASIELDQLDVPTLSALMYFLMMVVGTIGEALDLNPFNQPGVERGKKITQTILSEKLS